MPDSSAKHIAMKIAIKPTIIQEIIEAGPATLAAMEGTKKIPVPIIALMASNTRGPKLIDLLSSAMFVFP
jgi:hypothetical protein